MFAAVYLKETLLQKDVDLVCDVFAAVTGETTALRIAGILSRARPHQHLSQATAGELAGIATNNIEEDPLQWRQLG